MNSMQPMIPEPFSSDADRWQAVAARNADADGVFLYGVITTGIYCRPGCPSRRPRRDNVRFFANAEAARAAGLRACKRCQPDDHAGHRPHWLAAAQQALVQATERVDLDALAQRCGISRRQLDRGFKAATGLTPSQFQRHRRHQQLQARLRDGPSVTTAVFDAGFDTTSAAYADARARLGMSPGRFRAGGAGETLQFTHGRSSLGEVVIAATARGVCLIEFTDGPRDTDAEQLVHQRFPAATILAADTELASALQQIVQLVDGVIEALTLPLDARGTAFQEKVWQALREMRRGETLSYGELAARIGAPGSARAVARACASNRLAVAIPCHRIVTANGGISGYRWGVDRKRALLDQEQEPEQAR